MGLKFSEGDIIEDSSGTKVKITGTKMMLGQAIYTYVIVEMRTNPTEVGKIGEHRAHQIDSFCTLVKCQHRWKHYVGLTHTYDFCELCDEKRYK